MVSLVVTLLLIGLTAVVLCAPDRWDAAVWRFTERHVLIAFLLYAIAWPLAFFVLLLFLTGYANAQPPGC